ncbi:hypothetical protein SDC9_98375 [bioreactor metagenome]|uniref:Uncharacterized protein n=1 Tax=bioreactor metagenome TaxID=1076179 RepID=A0A645AEJ8_9ZZZZ
MLIIGSGRIDAPCPNIGDHHAHIAHVDQRFLNQFHRCEKPVDEVRAFDENLILSAAESARLEELLRVLEVIVVGFRIFRIVADRGSNDVLPVEGQSVVNGHDADFVVAALDDDRPESSPLPELLGHTRDRSFFGSCAHRQIVNLCFGDNNELREVERICTFTDDAPLGALLASVQ